MLQRVIRWTGSDWVLSCVAYCSFLKALDTYFGRIVPADPLFAISVGSGIAALVYASMGRALEKIHLTKFPGQVGSDMD